MYRARAPLRLGLAGGGTDVSPFCDLFGGAVLNATIDLYAHTTLAPGVRNRVSFIAQDLGISEEFPLDQPLPGTTRLPLHRGVYLRMMKDFRGGRLEPLTLTTHCDVPMGSGLGASSTIIVSMLRAFDEAWSLTLDQHALAQLAFTIERVDVGFAGGKQDQYSAAFGGFNFIRFQETGQVLVSPLQIPDNVISEIEASTILFYTGNPRRSAEIIEQESRNVREHNESAIEAMHKTKEAAYAMQDALLRGEVSAMGEIMQQAWEQKKRMADGITNPFIDSLYATAMRAGAYGGKVSGAGGGGYMMFLVDPARRTLVEAALTNINSKGMAPFSFTSQGAQAWHAE
jgi:D-glycero-alpha-D-manno-heptose-7-phosphate kinase